MLCAAVEGACDDGGSEMEIESEWPECEWWRWWGRRWERLTGGAAARLEGNPVYIISDFPADADAGGAWPRLWPWLPSVRKERNLCSPRSVRPNGHPKASWDKSRGKTTRAGYSLSGTAPKCPENGQTKKRSRALFLGTAITRQGQRERQREREGEREKKEGATKFTVYSGGKQGHGGTRG